MKQVKFIYPVNMNDINDIKGDVNMKHYQPCPKHDIQKDQFNPVAAFIAAITKQLHIGKSYTHRMAGLFTRSVNSYKGVLYQA